MSDGKNFEPYLDWAQIDDHMVSDLHSNMVAYVKAREDFISNPTKEGAAAVIKPQLELNQIMSAIYETIWTVPVMVHVAGTKTHDKDDDDNERVIQLCARCGSVLQVWREGMAAMTPTGPMPIEEDHLGWWDEGDVVAKAIGQNSMTMYEIPKDQKLEKHERPCPDFAKELG